MKKISVVIPCYNAENYIDRCISSLVCQTIGLEALELIFVNDASSDGTIEHLRAWEQKYPDSIVVIDCRENHRTGGARNIGMRRASAKYIGFMDNDDVVEPDMFERLYQVAEEYGCDIAAACYDRVSENGTHYDFVPQGKKEIPVICAEWKEGIAEYPGEVWNKIYRRDIILDNNIFFAENIHYAENHWELIMNYYIKSYYVVDKIMYHHMVNEKSILLSSDFNVHKDRLEAEIKKLEEIERRGLEDIHSERLENEFVTMYYLNTLHLFLNRNTELDIDVLQDMKREVLSRYPNYCNNTILQQEHMVRETDLFLLGTLEVELSEEDWKKIAMAYREGNHDVFIYMPPKKARRWTMYMYQDFLQLGVSILDMLINYGNSVLQAAVQWNGEDGLKNWKTFFSDYREVWGEFSASEDRLQDMMEKASLKEWCGCDREELNRIENRLENAEDMAQVRKDMETLVKMWEDSKAYYESYMDV